MNPDEELRQAKIGNQIVGYTLIMVPVFVIGSCIAALWVPACVGILMLIAFVASVAVAVWVGYFRHASGDPDTLAWYWPAQFPFVQVLLLVPSLVAAWWSWWGRAAALASLAAIVYWCFRVFRPGLRVLREARVTREQDRE
jgi:hypothetical protein